MISARLKISRDVFRETLRLYPPVPMMVREAAGQERFHPEINELRQTAGLGLSVEFDVNENRAFAAAGAFKQTRPPDGSDRPRRRLRRERSRAEYRELEDEIVTSQEPLELLALLRRDLETRLRHDAVDAPGRLGPGRRRHPCRPEVVELRRAPVLAPGRYFHHRHQPSRLGVFVPPQIPLRPA